MPYCVNFWHKDAYENMKGANSTGKVMHI